MKKTHWHILALLVCLVAVVLFTACTTEGDPTETGEGTGTQATTDAGTTAETEAVTAAPRYDYMEAEVLPVVSAEKTDGYRNKAQYAVGDVGGKLVAGFFLCGAYGIRECLDTDVGCFYLNLLNNVSSVLKLSQFLMRRYAELSLYAA